jgi:hypothetical protein
MMAAMAMAIESTVDIAAAQSATVRRMTPAGHTCSRPKISA